MTASFNEEDFESSGMRALPHATDSRNTQTPDKGQGGSPGHRNQPAASRIGEVCATFAFNV
jgi:hypothetical protein